MSSLEIWIFAIAVAMDCFAVSIASGIILKRFILRPMLTMAFLFGFFQAIMPLIGWVCANFFSHLIDSIDHWVAFIILAFLGGRMIKESYKDDECKHEFDPTRLKIILALAIATSIDAMAIGVSFAFIGMNDYMEILHSIGIIGLVSCIFSLFGLALGVCFGCNITKLLNPERWGGIILILIGTKILIEHLFFE